MLCLSGSLVLIMNLTVRVPYGDPPYLCWIDLTCICNCQEGLGNLSLKGTESTILALIILAIVIGLVGTAAFAATSQDQWITYFHLFDESRLVRHPYKDPRGAFLVLCLLVSSSVICNL